MNSFQGTSWDMYRLASLYNGTVLVQLEAMHWEVLVDDHLTDEGILHLDVQTYRKLREEVTLFGPQVSESRKRTAFSVNKCVSAIDFNTVWLAFRIEGLNVDIKEVTFKYPKPIHKVELWLCGSGCNEQEIVTEYPHTVLKLVLNNKEEEAIVADAKYA